MGRRAGRTPLNTSDGSDYPGESLVSLLSGPVPLAARGLLGCELHAGPVVVRLTEVEAYDGVGVDPASHAYRGRTARNQVMFGTPGLAYVYFVFGMHWCLNVVCGPPEHAAAVLLRAGEVIAGLDIAQARRGGILAQRDLARGPARLAVALGVDGAVNGTSLLDGLGPITLRRPDSDASQPDASQSGASQSGASRPEITRLGTERSAPTRPAIESGPRVGVANGADWPWRYWLAGESTVSGYRRHPAHRRDTTAEPAPSMSAAPELSDSGTG